MSLFDRFDRVFNAQQNVSNRDAKRASNNAARTIAIRNSVERKRWQRSDETQVLMREVRRVQQEAKEPPLHEGF